tara:strand:+ start:17 stop:331 length:315 start_codon:yes stop_codon:yes gene_type:complete
MVLYNITVSVDSSLAEEWIEYMHKDHIPAVLNTGHFRDFKLCRVEGDEQGGLTFAVQYVAHSVESFNQYQNECAPALQKEFIEKWGSKAAAFRTVLPIISEGKA